MTLIAKRIKMKPGCYGSNSLLEIDEIYIENGFNGWYKKEFLHDYVTKYPNSITVNTLYGPTIIPATSQKGEKFVKSTPNNTLYDNLLSLPKEYPRYC